MIVARAKKRRSLQRRSKETMTARLAASNTQMRKALKLARADLLRARNDIFLPHTFAPTLKAINAALDERR